MRRLNSNCIYLDTVSIGLAYIVCVVSILGRQARRDDLGPCVRLSAVLVECRFGKLRAHSAPEVLDCRRAASALLSIALVVVPALFVYTV